MVTIVQYDLSTNIKYGLNIDSSQYDIMTNQLKYSVTLLILWFSFTERMILTSQTRRLLILDIFATWATKHRQNQPMTYDNLGKKKVYQLQKFIITIMEMELFPMMASNQFVTVAPYNCHCLWSTSPHQ